MNEENYEQFRVRLETDSLCCDKTHIPPSMKLHYEKTACLAKGH
jgi:hypothetical protein